MTSIGIVIVGRNDVPYHFRQGEKYKRFFYTKQKVLEVPSQFYIEDLTVDNNDELYHLLDAYRYWEVNSLPHEVFHYVFVNGIDNSCLNEFQNYFTVLCIMTKIIKISNYNNRLSLVASNGHLGLLIYLMDNCNEEIDKAVTLAAARGGQLDALKELHRRHVPWHEWTAIASILHGAEDVAFYRLTKSLRSPDLSYLSSPPQYFQCLKFALLQHDCPKDIFVSHYAAYFGHMNCLALAYVAGCGRDQLTASCAAEGGHSACLKMLHEGNCPWDTLTCSLAAKAGQFVCLFYALTANCPRDKNTCIEAAANNHLNCLMLAHEYHCPWDAEVTAEAAFAGCLLTLKYAMENGCPSDERTCAYAAGNGYQECLEYAHDNQCPWDATTCTSAARGGHIDCLKFAHENGCPWDTEACIVAAQENNLECLIYLHRAGCSWSADTCSAAAAKGSYQCLRYCLEKGCPWNECTRLGARYFSDCSNLMEEFIARANCSESDGKC